MDDNNKLDSESNEEFQESDSDKPIDEIQEEIKIDKEEERKKEEFIKKEKNRGILYILAGAYLLYMVYTALIEPVFKGKLDMPTHFIVIFCVMGICGVLIILYAIKYLLKKKD